MFPQRGKRGEPGEPPKADERNENRSLLFGTLTLISLINMEVGINVEGVQKMQNH